jgi:ubiquinone/menaquinone biosynthesis C-methylase UbiE
MSRKRRQVGIDDSSSWIFNRMADVYDARPPYPTALVDTLCELATNTGPRVLDIGAGIGHLALPLAQRGLEVVAVEPARAMLDRLQSSAGNSGLSLQSFHAAAEALPLECASVDLSLIADALHFVDAELAGAQLRRVLVPRGVLAIVTCEFAETPFMREIQKLVAQASDRRPRDLGQAIRHVASVADVRLNQEWTFQDETPVDRSTLLRILKSVSFIGPAFGPSRFADFWQKVQAIPEAAVWARTFMIYAGRKPGTGVRNQ